MLPKPTTTRRGLLFLAGIVWAIAGGILAYRGMNFIDETALHPVVLFLVGASGGVLFFVFLFKKISARHILRILGITYERPCLFSFLSWKSYLVMTLMITLGVLVRSASWIPREELGTAYIMMAVPLLTSSFRFFKTGVKFAGQGANPTP
jgi:hypothetical protein